MGDVWSDADQEYMALALKLAASQLGRTGSNPAVGCVIVQNDCIVGQGATGDGGRPHGEALALSSVQGPTQGATVYVTLEPCAHLSQRGPSCATGLIEAGICRLVCCLQDPDPRTSGKGFERLMKAGIKVEIGLGAEQGHAEIARFSSRFST